MRDKPHRLIESRLDRFDLEKPHFAWNMPFTGRILAYDTEVTMDKLAIGLVLEDHEDLFNQLPVDTAMIHIPRLTLKFTTANDPYVYGDMRLLGIVRFREISCSDHYLFKMYVSGEVECS